jgi:isopentenyl-diphosphate delta-isomerase
MQGTSVTTTRELVVLVDDDGHPTGTADKATVHSADTALHLAFSAYLFDDDGRLLVTRRALDKRTFPGVWSNSVCGHPAPGESLPDAVLRRSKRELGVRVDTLRLVLPRFAYRAEMAGVVENELCPVYAGWVAPGSTVSLADDEVADAEWKPWGEFVDGVARGRVVSPWCAEQVPKLAALGEEPRAWPEAEDALLPPAARVRRPGGTYGVGQVPPCVGLKVYTGSESWKVPSDSSSV